MAAAFIEILGPLQLRSNGAVTEIPSRRQQAVLARLAVDVARPVAVDDLVEAVWGAGPPEHPAAAVQTVVSRLRSVLSKMARVEHGPAGYMLLLDDGDLDALLFERLTAEAGCAAPDRERELLERALALWRGPVCAGIDVPAVRERAEQIAATRTAATIRLGRLLINEGEFMRAIDHLRGLVHDDPLREDVAAELIEALLGAGRSAEALATFHDTRELLARELGVGPCASLQSLHRRILADRHPQSRGTESPTAGDPEEGLVGWALATAIDAVPAARRVGDGATLDQIGEHAATLALALRIARARADPRADLLAGKLAMVSSHRLDPKLVRVVRDLPEPDGAADRSYGALALAGAGRAATLSGDSVAGRRFAARAWRAAKGDPEVAYLAAHTLAIAHVYLGEWSEAVGWCRRQIVADDVVAHHADAHATLALISIHHGNSRLGQERATRAQRLADRSGADAYRAFATYAAGEVALGSGARDRADRLLQEANRLAVDANAGLVRGLAEIARGSLLVRSGQVQEAAALLRDALAQWRKVEVWPQTWTTIRLIGEVCAALGDPESTLLLLVAADRAQSAPAVTGDDAERLRTLRGRVEEGIGRGGVRGVIELARAMPVAAVLDRAMYATRPG